MKRNSPNLNAIAPQMFNADHAAGSVVSLAAKGAKLESKDQRAELLAALAAGELVELEATYVAYYQDRKSNRNFVRLADDAMSALAASGVGTPLLRDHMQNSIEARAGTVIASEFKSSGDRHTLIQTAKVTAPWAVEAMLRGNIDRFSVGWMASGPVLCSVCGTEAFAKCSHWPGDRVVDKAENKSKAKTQTVEFVFTAAELVECSAVSVPAVPAARIKEVRAALSAHFEREDMQETEERPALDLAATAGVAGPTIAVEEQAALIATLQATAAAAGKELADLRAQLAEFTAEKAKADEEAFIDGARREGKLNESLEASFRALFRANRDLAKLQLAAQPRINPVGAPMLSSQAAKDEALPTVTARDACESRGASYDRVKSILLSAGIKVTDEVIANTLTGKAE